MRVVWFFFAFMAVLTASANLIAFSVSTDAAFTLLNIIYPNQQDPTHYLKNPTPIRIHIYLNALSLIIGVFQFLNRTPVLVHKYLGYCYVTLLTIGSVGAIQFALGREFGTDGGFAAQFSFTWMAIASVLPALIGTFQIVFLNDVLAHKKWMHRSYACLFGSGVLFRVLANTYLPLAPSHSVYPAWIAMIWLSWVAPMIVMEIYLSVQDRKHLEQFCKANGITMVQFTRSWQHGTNILEHKKLA